MSRISFLRAAVCLLAAASAHGAPKELTFEVLSMRPMTPGANFSMTTAPGPNGFDSSLTLWQMIMIAWGPGGEPSSWTTMQVLNAPNWIGSFYNVNARVSQADLKAWQNQGREHELLRSALRAALKNRCQLVVHEQPAQGRTYEMVIAKGGPKLKAADEHAVLPEGVKLQDGGVMTPIGSRADGGWKWYRASMEDLSKFLRGISGAIPVRDKTGLTGRYDFTLPHVQLPPDEEHVYGWPVDGLGLKLKPGTEGRPNLVIDHIEQPTAN